MGPLKVCAADGSDKTPRGQKARGLLALLALAPGNTRARHWLQDKLWSDRGPKQGSDSLRQCLAEIRKSFGAARSCLVSKGQMVTLDTSRITIVLTAQRGLTNESPILFENLDVRDGEFEDWLRDRRSEFENAEPLDDDDAPVAKILAKPAAPIEIAAKRLQIVVSGQRPATGGASKERLIADTLTDIVTRTVSELGTVDIVDLRKAGPRAGHGTNSANLISLAVLSEAVTEQSRMNVRLAVSSESDNRLLWSGAVQRTEPDGDLHSPELLRTLNQMAEEIFSSFDHIAKLPKEHGIASLLARQATKCLFRLGRSNLMMADRLFERAFALEPRGVYLAWRAYLRTYLLAELLAEDRQVVAEEAVAFMYQALEMEPRNSYVAAFSAQVHSIARQSPIAAFELAERSVELNPANPMGWACLGIAECYLGKAQAGLEHALLARELVGATPLRFQINALACIAATMAGDIDGSILLGEAAHGLAPDFKPPMRFLSALYLLRDQHEQSQVMVDRLKRMEPNFSYDLLRDRGYPASSLHRSKLLEKLPGRQI